MLDSETQQTCIEDQDTGIEVDMSKQHNITSWPTMSSDSLGKISGKFYRAV